MPSKTGIVFFDIRRLCRRGSVAVAVEGRGSLAACVVNVHISVELPSHFTVLSFEASHVAEHEAYNTLLQCLK